MKNSIVIDDRPKSISVPYLLVTFLPFHVDEFGVVWLNRLWLKDLMGHLDYIDSLSLLAPKHKNLDFDDPVCMPGSFAKRVKFIALPSTNSLGQAFRALPRTILLSWRAVSEAFIVHSSVIGWPLPLGWIVNPIVLARRKILFIVIESAPWRITSASRSSWKDKVRSQITEKLASFFVNRANLTLFTQEGYRSSIATKPRGKTMVVPASWIDEDDIISLEDCGTERQVGPVRFFCPSRLTYDKGIGVLLDALRILERSKLFCEVTIMGLGELKSVCENLGMLLSAVRLRVLDPVDYGEPFFRFIRDNDCLVIPIISDEQPRIIFDSYSQGRLVIASDTDGLRQHVHEGQTGWLVKPNDPVQLAQAMRMIIENIEVVGQHRTMTRSEAMKLTHQVMHLRRWKALSDLIESG